MTTIEERLLSVAAVSSALNAQRGMNVGAPIIEEWNTATALLRRALLLIKSRLYELCEADDARVHFYAVFGDEEWPDTILYREIEAHIAKMEGNSPSRDKAMVEDKRYERNDIYKK